MAEEIEQGDDPNDRPDDDSRLRHPNVSNASVATNEILVDPFALRTRHEIRLGFEPMREVFLSDTLGLLLGSVQKQAVMRLRLTCAGSNHLVLKCRATPFATGVDDSFSGERSLARDVKMQHDLICPKSASDTRHRSYLRLRMNPIANPAVPLKLAPANFNTASLNVSTRSITQPVPLARFDFAVAASIQPM